MIDYEKTSKEANATKQKTRYSYTDIPSNEEGVLSLKLDYLFGQNSDMSMYQKEI